MSFGLTPRQRDCLRAIETHIAAHGVSPTYDELRAALGYRSKGNVSGLVLALRERGHIEYLPRKDRSIRVLTHHTRAEAPAAAFTLPPKVALSLAAFCAAHDENPADVVADAVTLFIDEARAGAGDRSAS